MSELEPVTLTGAFVRLEPLAQGHLDGIMHAGADDSIWAWLPWRPETRSDYMRFIEEAWGDERFGPMLPWTTIDVGTDEVVGSTRLLAYSAHNRRVEIGGTWLAPSSQRSAINTEAKLLQLTHCFEKLSCVRVELKTDARNERSRAAIARIGGRFEGIMRKHMLTRGGVHRDSAYFSITDDDWPDVKLRLEEMLARDRA